MCVVVLLSVIHSSWLHNFKVPKVVCSLFLEIRTNITVWMGMKAKKKKTVLIQSDRDQKLTNIHMVALSSTNVKGNKSEQKRKQMNKTTSLSMLFLFVSSANRVTHMEVGCWPMLSTQKRKSQQDREKKHTHEEQEKLLRACEFSLSLSLTHSLEIISGVIYFERKNSPPLRHIPLPEESSSPIIDFKSLRMGTKKKEIKMKNINKSTR